MELKELLEESKKICIGDEYNNIDDLIEIFYGDDDEFDGVSVYIPEYAEEELLRENFDKLESEFKKIEGLENIYQQDRDTFTIDEEDITKPKEYYLDKKRFLQEKVAEIYLKLLLLKK